MPAVVKRAASVAPLFPTANLMKSVVPTPEVDLRVSDEPAAVPPTSIGLVIWVVKVGEVAKTASPEPVSSVIAPARLADDGVARKVATPAPRPETPVEIGRPVAFVKVAADGVPRLGVVKTGLVVYATTPVPDSSERMFASFAEVLIEEVERNPRLEVAAQTGTPPDTWRI